MSNLPQSPGLPSGVAQTSSATLRAKPNGRSQSHLDRTLAVNNSKSNQRFSFGKDQRFKDPRIDNDIVQYDLPDTIRIKGALSKNQNAGFGASIPDRFFDLAHKKRTLLPGPAQYFEQPRDYSPLDDKSLKHCGSRNAMHSVIERNKYSSLEHSASQLSINPALENQSPTSQTKETRNDRDSTCSVAQSVNLKNYISSLKNSGGKQYSFGVGRAQMYPIHVDSVIRKSQKLEAHAGPIYNLPRTFGKQGVQMGFGIRDPYPEYKLQSQGKLPGPGQYMSPRDHIYDKHSLRQIEKNASPTLRSHLVSPSDLRLKSTIDIYSSKEFLSTRRNPASIRLENGAARFRMSKDLALSPSPMHNYNPQKTYEMAKKSLVFKNSGTTIIGKT